MNFKEFLLESRGRTELSKDEAQALFETDYSEAYNCKQRIYRGIKSSSSNIFLYSTPLTARIPLEGGEIYNKLFSLAKANKRYPSRYKSIICTTSQPKALSFGDVYVVYPKNGTKIAICPKPDIWLIKPKYFKGYYLDLSESMNFLADLAEEEKIMSLSNITELNKIIIKNNPEITPSDLGNPESCFSFNELGFKLKNIDDFDTGSTSNELWFEGNAIMVKAS